MIRTLLGTRLHRALPLLALLVSSLPGQAQGAELVATPSERMVSNIVGTMLSYHHYSETPINDKMATRWLDTYLEGLDPNHMIFLQSDIDKFLVHANQLDNELTLRQPSLKLPLSIYQRYQELIDMRLDYALELLDAPFDLTIDESLLIDRSELPWPNDHATANEVWRKHVKEEIIRGELAKRERDEVLETLRKRYQSRKKSIQEIVSIDVLELWLSALTTSFDPHSAYFKPATRDNFDIEMSNSVEGIGAVLRTEGDYTTVIELVAGGPAALGEELQVGDRIVGVAQGSDKITDIIGQRIDNVVKLIRGPKGTEVRLTVIPAGLDPSIRREIAIIRDRVLLKERAAKGEVHELSMGNGQPLKLLVIDIPSFYVAPPKLPGVSGGNSAADDVRRILQDIDQDEIDGVALDLRHNGGGGLGEAIEIAGLFIKSGPIVQVRERDGSATSYDDPDTRMVYDGPLMVLTSPLSASASEIVAGAMQDYGRALIVGSEATHGKGTVQSLIRLNQFLESLERKVFDEDIAGSLKLTTQQFYRVSGGSTQSRGVKADVVLPSPYDAHGMSEADLDHALPWNAISPVRYRPVGDVDPLLPSLREASANRVSSSEDFQRLQAAIAERDRADQRTTLSLDLETRRQELAETLERLGEEEDPSLTKDEADGTADGTDADEETKQDDTVLDEALLIMRDYLDLDPTSR